MKIVDSESEGSTETPLDNDTCDETEISHIFNLKCDRISTTVVDNKRYVLHIDGTTTSTPNVILGLSNNVANIYNFSNNQIAKIHSVEVNENVVGVKACNGNENLFYVASNDCQVQLVDLRDTNSKHVFKDTTVKPESIYKLLNSIDVSSNDLLLSGGTDVYAGDAFILFWDIRNVKLLGAYWESHTDDVTEVKFHPSDPNKLISGSTDGLINTYDLSKSMEDDALIDSFNTESSVEQLCWFNEGNNDMISCITHMDEVQIWKLDGVQPSLHFRRADLTKQIKRNREDYCYVANMLAKGNGKILGLVGSYYPNSECLRGFGFDKDGLVPLFNVSKNEQKVRCSWLSKNEDILITAGENGTMEVWDVDTNFETSGIGGKC